MLIGRRWKVRTPPPGGLAPEFVMAIEQTEVELRPLKVDTSEWYWTLTYLEGKPVVELDDGTTIREDPSGSVHVTQS